MTLSGPKEAGSRQHPLLSQHIRSGRLLVTEQVRSVPTFHSDEGLFIVFQTYRKSILIMPIFHLCSLPKTSLILMILRRTVWDGSHLTKMEREVQDGLQRPHGRGPRASRPATFQINTRLTWT